MENCGQRQKQTPAKSDKRNCSTALKQTRPPPLAMVKSTRPQRNMHKHDAGMCGPTELCYDFSFLQVMSFAKLRRDMFCKAEKINLTRIPLQTLQRSHHQKCKSLPVHTKHSLLRQEPITLLTLTRSHHQTQCPKKNPVPLIFT